MINEHFAFVKIFSASHYVAAILVLNVLSLVENYSIFILGCDVYVFNNLDLNIKMVLPKFALALS